LLAKEVTTNLNNIVGDLDVALIVSYEWRQGLGVKRGRLASDRQYRQIGFHSEDEWVKSQVSC